MKLKNKKYKRYEIYYYEDKFLNISKDIINENFQIIKTYKDTVRNYVTKISLKNEEYVLKSPKAENVIPQRKFLSVFKSGEALSTLKNIKEAEERGITEFVKIYAAIVKRNIFIQESYILMENIEGEILKDEKDIDKVLKVVERLHKNNIYHGDLNTSNFLKINNKIKIIDSQAKKEKFWNFKRWYDIFTLEEDLLVLSLHYNVKEKYNFLKKDIGYYTALFLKKFKNILAIKKIKRIKKKLRQKGWKI